MKYRKLILGVLVGAWVSCSSPSTSQSKEEEAYFQQPVGEAGDTLKILSQTLGIGFSVTDLIVVDKSDSAALFDRLEALLFEFLGNHPKERVSSLSQGYLEEQPDLIFLQELTQMRQDGVMLSDFPTEILNQLNKDSLRYQMFFQSLNALTLKVKRSQGDTLSNGVILAADTTLDVSFNEGNAIYYPASLQVQSSDGLFDNLVQFPFLQGNFTSERGSQWIQFQTPHRSWKLWHTHFEISDNGLAPYSKNQATELLLITQAERDTSVSQLVMGNFNFTPGLGAHKILTGAGGFVDLYTRKENEEDWNCCLELNNPFDGNSRQVDYILGRHIGVDYRVRQRTIGPIIQDTLSFWPATHSALIATVVGY